MFKSNYRPYFREIWLTPQQENQALACIHVKFRAFNLYLDMQLHLYRVYQAFKKSRHVKFYKQLNKHDKKLSRQCFLSARKYRNWFNQVYRYLPQFHDQWMGQCNVPKHTLVHGFHDANIACEHYQKGLTNQPHFKNKYSHHSFYVDGHIHISRTLIKLPHFTPIHLTEKGSIPTDKQLRNQNAHVKCAYISLHANKWYISIMTSLPMPTCYIPRCQLHGHLGIDVGIKSEAVVNALNGYKATWFKNISKSKKYKRLIIHRDIWQKRINRRPSNYRKKQKEYNKSHFRPISKGYLYAKQQYEIKCRQISNLTKGNLRKIAYQIIQRKPKSITIEHLDIKGMLKNHKLAKAISRCNWGYFYKWLKWLCQKYGIELRQVSKYYPSTKICHLCHHYNHSQFNGTLSDLNVRIMHCKKYDVNYDRDLNASINLANAKKYKVLVNPIY